MCQNSSVPDFIRPLSISFVHGVVLLTLLSMSQTLWVVSNDSLFARDNTGNTCLHTLAQQTETQTLLIQKIGCQTSTRKNNLGQTILHNLMICQGRNFESIKLLVEVTGIELLLFTIAMEKLLFIFYLVRMNQTKKCFFT